MWTAAHLLRSIFTLGIAQVISWVSTAALTIVLPRVLGDVNLGQLAFALATTSMLGFIADLGVTTYLGKEIARRQLSAPALVANALAIRVPLGLLAAAAAIGLSLAGGQDAATRGLVMACCVAMILDGFGNVLLAALQGLGRMKAMAVSIVATKVVFAALAIGLIAVGSGPLGVVAASVTSLALGIAISSLVLRPAIPMQLRLDLRVWRELTRGGLPFFVWQAALTVYSTIDIIMLKFITHDAVVGWYSAAYRIVSIPAFVPAIVMTVVFPALTASARDEKAFAALARRALHGVVIVSLPMAVGTIVVADPLLKAFGYPDAFVNSVLPIQLLALHIPLVAVDTLIGTILAASDRQSKWAMTGVAAAFLNPAMNLIAIPFSQQTFGNGAIGAAAITTMTELFMLVFGLRLLPRGVFDANTTVRIAKAGLAAALMAILVSTVRDLGLVVPVIVGVLSYGAAAVALGALSVREIRELFSHLRRRDPVAVTAAAAQS